MPKWIQWLVFGFSAIGSVAGVLKIFEYFGVKPEAGKPVSALVWGITFILVSVGSSAWGFYLLYKTGVQLKAKDALLKQKDGQLEQAKTLHVNDERELLLKLSQLSEREKELSILNRRLATWPKAQVFFALAEDAARMLRRLQTMLQVARDPLAGNEQFTDALAKPLSDIYPITEKDLSVSFKMQKWRFQEDFVELRDRLPKSAGFELTNCSVPNDLTGEEVMGLLKRHGDALTAHAATLLSAV